MAKKFERVQHPAPAGGCKNWKQAHAKLKRFMQQPDIKQHFESAAAVAAQQPKPSNTAAGSRTKLTAEQKTLSLLEYGRMLYRMGATEAEAKGNEHTPLDEQGRPTVGVHSVYGPAGKHKDLYIQLVQGFIESVKQDVQNSYAGYSEFLPERLRKKTA